MTKPILYYWALCPTCLMVVSYADELGIELDKRDVEQIAPYHELLGLGGDANKIPYLYHEDHLLQGVEECKEYLRSLL